MIPILGRALILLALLSSTAGAVVAFAAGKRGSDRLALLARRFGYTYCASMIAAALLMIFALLNHDFSVSYVAQVGSRAVPTWVTIVSLWSSLEGSILFWGAVLGIYIAVALRTTSASQPEYTPYANGVWLACASFFSFLISGPAQPFNTVSPAPLDGPGPNPLLQNHVLMAVHPPFLYLGYVGMTIPFGFAAAALLRGRLGHAFLPTLRTSLLVAWTFLTVAIVLGGWWAYEVLGWGGYWAWDPVENASLLPWLTATAALHSAIVMERRGTLKGWTVTLVMSSFLLTVLGTFMTRSGVFNSVHSFTQSSIGPTILVFLAIALIFSVVTLAMRIDKLASEGNITSAASREAMFLVNNLFFVLLTFTILIGTVFPLLVEALQGVQMSVGRPYFDKMAVPIGLCILFVMGIGPALPWGRADREQMRRTLITPLIGAALFTIAGYLTGIRVPWTLITLFFAGYTAQVTMREMLLPVRQRMQRESLSSAVANGLVRRGGRRFGAYVVHTGAVIIFIAIAVSSTMGRSQEIQLQRGGSAKLGRYDVTFTGAEVRQEPHRQSTVANLLVTEKGRVVARMAPRMNIYEGQREPIGTPDVRSRLTHDLYVSIMNVDPATQSVGLRVMINPMISWIWGAAALMALGGVITLLTRRRVLVVGPREVETVDGLREAVAAGETR
jgi:cytochrome c-type biogenesis protein CcmF